VKPFSPRELMARVKAVLRRAPRPNPGRKARLIHDDIILDLDKRQLSVAVRPVALTPHEYAILEALMSAPAGFSRVTNCWIASIPRARLW